MGNVGDLIVRLGLDTTPFDIGMGRATAGLRSFGVGLGVTSGLGTLAFALTASAKSAVDFSHQMAEIATLLPDGMKHVDEMTESLKKLSKQYGKGPREEAAALYEIISAGASNAAQAQDILNISNKLAVGGVTDVKTAADGLTSVMAAYAGKIKDATEVSDAFFIGAKNGKTRVEELSRTIGTVAPIASQTGVALDEVVAAISALTKGGVTTETAVVGIRQILASVVVPTREARAEAAALGLQFNAQALAAKGLSGFLKDVQEKTHGSAEAQGLLFGNIRALSAIMSLTGNLAGDFAINMDELAHKTGATDRAFKLIAENSPAFVFSQLGAAAKVAAIDVGTSVVSTILPAMRDLIENLDKVAPAARAATEALGVAGLLFALSKISTMIAAIKASQFAIAIYNMSDAFVSARAAGYGFAASMGAVNTSLGMVLGQLIGSAGLVAWVLALANALNTLHQNEQTVQGRVDAFNKSIGTMSTAHNHAAQAATNQAIALNQLAAAQAQADMTGRNGTKASLDAIQRMQTAKANIATLTGQLRLLEANDPSKLARLPGVVVSRPSESPKIIPTGGNVPVITSGGETDGEKVAKRIKEQMDRLYDRIDAEFAIMKIDKNREIGQSIVDKALAPSTLFPGDVIPLKEAMQATSGEMSKLQLAVLGMNEGYNKFLRSQDAAIIRMDAFGNALSQLGFSLTGILQNFLASHGAFGKNGGGVVANLGAQAGGGIIQDIIKGGLDPKTLIGKILGGGALGGGGLGKLAGGLLGSLLPGLGTIAGGLAGSLVGSIGGKIGGFIGGLFGHHKKKVDDNAAALEKMTAAVESVNEALSFVPTGFKIALARFDAQDGRVDPRVGSGAGESFDPVAIPIGDIYIDARDRTAREVYDEFEAERRRRLLARYGDTSAGGVAA